MLVLNKYATHRLRLGPWHTESWRVSGSISFAPLHRAFYANARLSTGPPSLPTVPGPQTFVFEAARLFKNRLGNSIPNKQKKKNVNKHAKECERMRRRSISLARSPAFYANVRLPTSSPFSLFSTSPTPQFAFEARLTEQNRVRGHAKYKHLIKENA